MDNFLLHAASKLYSSGLLYLGDNTGPKPRKLTGKALKTYREKRNKKRKIANHSRKQNIKRGYKPTH